MVDERVNEPGGSFGEGARRGSRQRRHGQHLRTEQGLLCNIIYIHIDMQKVKLEQVAEFGPVVQLFIVFNYCPIINFLSYFFLSFKNKQIIYLFILFIHGFSFCYIIYMTYSSFE